MDIIHSLGLIFSFIMSRWPSMISRLLRDFQGIYFASEIILMYDDRVNLTPKECIPWWMGRQALA
jgi:hypothetical protein